MQQSAKSKLNTLHSKQSGKNRAGQGKNKMPRLASSVAPAFVGATSAFSVVAGRLAGAVSVCWEGLGIRPYLGDRLTLQYTVTRSASSEVCFPANELRSRLTTPTAQIEGVN